MHQRAVVLSQYLLTSVLLAFVVVSVIGQLQRIWYIDFGTPAARIYATQLRESEQMTIGQHATTVQWSYATSHIPLPVAHQPQIITIRTIMRAESPPQRITLTNETHAVAILPTPGVRNHHLYIAQGSYIAIRCDMQGISDTELATICVAVDWMRGQPAAGVRAVAPLLWMLALIVAVCVLAWVVATRIHPWRAWVVIGVVTTVLLRFAAQSIMYAPQLTLVVAGVAVGWWVLARQSRPIWQRIAGQAMLANVAIKGLGALVPGYFGTDLFFHVNRFVGVFSGQFYQIADGQGQTYPYPPGVYQLLAPLVLPLMAVFPTHYVMIFTAIIVDSSTILIVAWMCQRLAWSHRSIALMACLYVVLPAGFLMQWQATVAQNIGQWLGMMAIATSLWRITMLSVIAMAWTVVGHFGAFLTLHLAYTIAVAFRELRQMAWWWWGVVVVMGGLFYSQYVRLIYEQLYTHYIDDPATQMEWQTRWWDLVWKYGVYGHYLGIAVVLAIVGLILAPRDRWWQMAVAMMTSTGLLLVAQVFGGFNATRYMIFIFPVVASFAGLALGRLCRGRAGHVMILALLAFIALQSSMAWFNGTLFGVRVGFLW
jgi:hypothetical protein